MFIRTILATGWLSAALSLPAHALPESSSAAHPGEARQAQTTPPLTLAAAIDLALSQHPELQASQWNLDAAQAGITQARLRPNPELIVESEDVGRSTQTLSTQWVQTIELGNKRSRRIDAAQSDYRRSQWERMQKRNEIVANVRAAFIQALLAHEQMLNQQSSYQLMQEWASSVQKRVEAGKASPLESDRAELNARAAQDALQRSKHDWSVAMNRLALHLGQDDPRPISAKGIPSSVLPPWEQVKAALAEAPRSKIMEADIERQQAEVALQSSLRTQDIQLSVGGRHYRETGDNGLMLGVSVPLPLINRNQGGIRQAELRLQETRALQQARKRELELQALSTWEQLRSLQTSIRLYDDQLLPGAERAFQKAREGYQAGKFSFLETLDAQRALLSVRTERHELLKRYAELEGELNAMIGNAPVEASPAQGSPE